MADWVVLFLLLGVWCWGSARIWRAWIRGKALRESVEKFALARQLSLCVGWGAVFFWGFWLLPILFVFALKIYHPR